MFKLGSIEIDDSTFPREIDRSRDGITTCLFHRQHEWSMAHYVPLMPKCTICGGICDPRQTAHELCEARQLRGLPITQLDSTPKCSCKSCAVEE